MKKLMNDKDVFFIPKDKNTEIMVPHPKPSKNYLPQWFKDMPPALSDLDNNKMDETAKKCIPFLDSLTSGYTQELACDLEIKNHGFDEETQQDIITYNWSGPFKPMSTRMEETRSRNSLPNFDGYYSNEQHWNSFWEPKTPKGYSTLYYHPANRFDLPFMTMNAIIDTDNWSLTGPVPFLIKKGFQGIIPAGTPIYQMIFIKREKWNSFKKEYNEEEQKSLEYGVRRFFKDGYKKLHWEKKDYL
jgi:hypothetical protein